MKVKEPASALTTHLLYVSSFLVQMNVRVVGIVVPIYAAHIGASPMLLGIIGAMGGLIYSFMPLFSGFLSDRFGRKLFILISISTCGSSYILYALAGSPILFIPIRAIEWFSIALFWPAVEALLADFSGGGTEETLKKFNLSWGSASVLGPVIGGSIISALGIENKSPFLIPSAISFALIPSIIMFVKEPPRERAPRRMPMAFYFDVEWLRSSSMAILSIFTLYFVNGTVLSLFPAYAANLGIPAHEIGLIVLFSGLSMLIAFLKAYKIKFRVGESNSLLLGFTMLTFASALIASSHYTPILSMSFLALGFGAGMLYSVSIADILGSKKDARGQAAGLFESSLGFGYFLGPLFGGFLAEVSLNAPYIMCSLLCLVCALITLSVRWLQKAPG